MLGHYQPALFTALRRGYGRADVAADLGAGLLVGVVALPLSLALAIAAGAPPQVGLWTAIVGGFLIALLGGSRVQIGGPAGAFVPLCVAVVQQFGLPGLALATVMSGLLQLFLGICRLGTVIAFIPIPVVIGFTTGIAVILASTQLGPALGIPDSAQPIEHLHERVAHLWHGRHAIHALPLAVCAGTVALIALLRRTHPRLPGGLIAIALAAAAVWASGWEGSGRGEVATIATRYPEFAHGLPLFSWPSLAWFAPDPAYVAQLERQGAHFDWIRYLVDLSQFALAQIGRAHV